MSKIDSITTLSCLLNLMSLLVFVSTAGTSHSLVNTHLIVSATRSPLVKDRNLSIVSSGLLEEIVLDILVDHLKFTYEIRPPFDSLSPGYLLPNGSWTGIAGQLQRKEVDMCISTTAPAPSKLSVMEYSQSVNFVETGILIPFPSERGKAWVDTTVFQNKTWIALAVSSCFMIGVTWLVNKLTTKTPKHSQNLLSYWIFFYLSIWTSQGIIPRNSSVHFRLICLVSCFGIYIITNYFTATYTSFLSIPIFKISIKSIEDLANSNTVKTLVIKGSSNDEYILASTDPTIKKIGDQIRQHPSRRIVNAFTVADIAQIVKNNYALVIVKSNGESLIQQSYLLNNNTCKLTMAENAFFSRAQTFSYPKDSPIVSQIDIEILRMHQSGLFQYAERRSAISYIRCSVTEIKKIKAGKIVSLTLDDVVGAFVLMTIGTGLALVVWIVEFAVKRMAKKTQ